MQSVSFPQNTPFDEATGDLRPNYRDAYLLGQLTPVPAQQVEAYLRRNAIQRSVLLGRYHELAAKATHAGRTLEPPHWVQLQLQQQASYSALGPLRRPLVRGVLSGLLLLCLASVVQWLRNEPLLPAPVAAAVGRAATSAKAATRQLVQRLMQPAPPALAPAAKEPVAARRPAVARAPQAAGQMLPVLAIRPAAIAPLTPDSALVPAVPARVVAPAPPPVVVHGRISDTDGKPLPGATVLVSGTALATSADANGDYTLTVPAGSQLQYGYGGYSDQVLTATSSALDAALVPKAKASRRAR